MDFIDKNLNEDLFRLKIKECIEYLTTIQIGNDDLTDYFEYDFKDKKIKIPFKDILYIETVGSAYKLNLVGKIFKKKLREVYQMSWRKMWRRDISVPINLLS